MTVAGAHAATACLSTPEAADLKELTHLEKQDIPADESRPFRFEINPGCDLAFVDCHGIRILESGDFLIIVSDKKIKLTLR